MHFNLLDAVVEQSADRIVTIKQVSLAEEYLQDHFPDFPVLPGVMMIETIVHAARRLLRDRTHGERLVLGGVRALKYGSFVKPGDTLRVEVTLHKDLGDGSYEVKAEGTAVRSWAAPASPEGEGSAARVAVSGRLVLRPVRLGV
jgi:3-hydroxyacyl-[acyl-carrier-protein] dehydratase